MSYASPELLCLRYNGALGLADHEGSLNQTTGLFSLRASSGYSAERSWRTRCILLRSPSPNGEGAGSDKGEDGVDTRANQAAIEKLWCQALTTYQEAGLEEHLKAKWPGDPNVTERITYNNPPTFQPGYVGRHYFEGTRRIVLLGQNPGPGRKADDEDLVYRPELEAFARGETSFVELNESLAKRILTWGAFAKKGDLPRERCG